jgi:hypothetical protein
LQQPVDETLNLSDPRRHAFLPLLRMTTGVKVGAPALALLALHAALARAAAPPPPPAPWDAVLHLHSNATRDALNARCLDGSNCGFWIRPAQNPAAATKWKIHFQGVRARRR